MDKDFIKAIAFNTGLQPETVKDLFDHGWTYITELNQPRKWVQDHRNGIY